MKTSSQPARKTSHLKIEMEGRVKAYVLAAGAIAAGFLSGKPADAEIVYTPVDVSTSFGVIQLDLNNDGVYDFILLDHSFIPNGTRNLLAIRRLVIGGSASAGAITKSDEADMLQSGETIGSSRTFVNVHDPRLLMAGAKEVYGGSTGTCCFEGYGNWENVTKRYLGLKFQINGETHYGWVRASVKTSGFSVPWYLKIKVTGYAYETNPNQSIIAGDTGNEKADAKADGTLGALALGSLRAGHSR